MLLSTVAKCSGLLLITVVLSSLVNSLGLVSDSRGGFATQRWRAATNTIRLSRSTAFSSVSADESALPDKCETLSTSIVLPRKSIPRRKRRLRRLLSFGRHGNTQSSLDSLYYTYKYEKLANGQSNNSPSTGTTGVILVHPIGVGISRWFYERFFSSIAAGHVLDDDRHTIYLAPDLLGSGSASNPTLYDSTEVRVPPMLNISDWSNQLLDLMVKTERMDPGSIDRWCVVANGGCSPIALRMAQRSVEGTTFLKAPVTNVVLSSVPRLPFFQERADQLKVQKSYRTLCGITGKLFWWYACRNKGAFVQKFSEKNLVADSKNLGSRWRPNCFRTATENKGKSKYSTFAFLAGVLQDGCVESLSALKDSIVQIDVIKGRYNRPNPARSWFWSKRKPKRKTSNSTGQTESPDGKQETFPEFLKANGYGGREEHIDGRICLAHEDSEGYCDAVSKLLG